ncbi:MAG: Mov34/MPN/PAD-1 family protein [Candidatus Hodarchaeota archaeon]
MEKKAVVLNRIVYREIIDLLLKKPRIELVGLGFGFSDESQIILTNFVPMQNLDNSPISFSLDYEVMYKEIQNYEREGKSLIAFFHSHPQNAELYPSNKDLHFMRNWPFPYLWIIGRNNSQPELIIYALIDEKIHKIPFSITQG